MESIFKFEITLADKLTKEDADIFANRIINYVFDTANECSTSIEELICTQPSLKTEEQEV